MQIRQRCPDCNGTYRHDQERGVVCHQCGRSPGWQRPPTEEEGRAVSRARKFPVGGALTAGES